MDASRIHLQLGLCIVSVGLATLSIDNQWEPPHRMQAELHIAQEGHAMTSKGLRKEKRYRALTTTCRSIKLQIFTAQA